MEKEINIAEILKDKPQGTKLYSSACGKCTLEEADDKSFKISFYNSKFGFMNGGEGYLDKNGKLYDEGECVVFPSREMRDWRKFDWKKGDVLVSNDSDSHIIFKGFSKDDYTIFEGKHWISVSKKRHISCLGTQNTQNYHIEDNKEVAQTYINTIEERLGGKLNLETLEIEKQSEFKDGDILFTKTNMLHFPSVFILDTNRNEMRSYVRFLIERGHIDYGMPVYNLDTNRFRYATEEEKQRLFEALAKENKAWDAEKKAIVDLKPKCEFKPFDRCIWKIRNCEGSIWQASFVSYVDEYGATPMGMSIDEDLVNLIILPYNEETAKLIGTTDDWKGDN